MKMNKVVVYTAITGGYEKLKEPKFRIKNWDYICFTDNIRLKSRNWEIKEINYNCNNPIKKARRYKILPHLYLSEYNYSIWIDGSMVIIGDLKEFIEKKLENYKMAFFKHRGRNCIYEEARICKIMGRDNPQIISQQINKYREEGFPKNQGLVESGVIIRKHNEENVKKIMEAWWREVELFSIRDQLSFNYVIWKHNGQYKEIDENILKNQYFKRIILGRKLKK